MFLPKAQNFKASSYTGTATALSMLLANKGPERSQHHVLLRQSYKPDQLDWKSPRVLMQGRDQQRWVLFPLMMMHLAIPLLQPSKPILVIDML
jgi:hypothetical protein